MCHVTRLFLLAGLQSGSLALSEYTPTPGLGDMPIVGGKLQYLLNPVQYWYLDGAWDARCVTPPPPPPSRNGSCAFEANVDFDVANVSHVGMMSARDQAECCFRCWNRAGCAAAVFVTNQPTGSNCYAKNKAALSKKTTRPNRVACVLGTSSAPPPSPPPPPPCTGGHMSATVPGDVLSDLHRAGKIGDPLYELNFKDKDQQALWIQDWTYSRTFTLLEHGGNGTDIAAGAILVFDSIKMGARVYVDGTFLGTVKDQFLRYTFPLAGKLGTGAQHNVSVVFDQSIDTQGRFMACSGGWDWAPYTRVMATGGGSMMSKGIVRSVYIAYLPQPQVAHPDTLPISLPLPDLSPPPGLITAVVTEILYKGRYPAAPLTDATKGNFEVRVRIHVLSHTAWSGGVQVNGSWSNDAMAMSHQASVPAGESNFTVVLAAASTDVLLWWPAGLGERPLYNISARLVSSDGASVTESAVRRVGFRTLAIVTGNDTDPAWVAANTGADGSANPPLGMFFRINGATIFARGGNLVPLDELEGRNTASSHRALVQSVADGGMNILRIWGGGVYQIDSFYDAADEFGVLLYHDIQYAQNGHGPAVTMTQEAELRYQIRRLSHHPAVILYDGCNECLVGSSGSSAIYADFVLSVVASEDLSRVVWPSSPGDGWLSGVDRLTGLPNGKKLVSSGTHDKIEVHGPYNWASGRWPAVNGDNGLPPTGLNEKDESHCTTGAIGCRGWGPDFTHIPLRNLTRMDSGLGKRNWFSSEGGTVVMSSFESMAPTLAKEHWSLHGGSPPDDCHAGGAFGHECTGTNVMSQRNYPCDDLIWTYFGNASVKALDEVGEVPFKRSLYQCQLAQALVMSQTHSVMRVKNWAPAYPQSSFAPGTAFTQNTHGIIVWMLNEIWPTGGWGSLEYSQAAVGSVLGGRWKPLHYFFRRTLFTDQFATCAAATPTSGSDRVAGGESKGWQREEQLQQLLCGIVNDSPWEFEGWFTLTSIDLTRRDDSGSNTLQSLPLKMAEAGASEWRDVTLSAAVALNPATTVLLATITNSSNHTVHENLIPLTSPEKMRLPPANVTATVSGLMVTVSTDWPALWVVLTCAAHGRFEDNAFLLRGGNTTSGSRTLEFIPFLPDQEEVLHQTLRVEHVKQHMMSD